MNNKEQEQELSFEKLTPAEAARAVFRGYGHYMYNPLTRFSLHGMQYQDQLVMTAGEQEREAERLSRLKPALTAEETAKSMAQTIRDKVRNAIRQQSYSSQESPEPENDWFKMAEKKVAQVRDKEDRAELVKALKRIKRVWANLLELTEADKPINLPVRINGTGKIYLDFDPLAS